MARRACGSQGRADYSHMSRIVVQSPGDECRPRRSVRIGPRPTTTAPDPARLAEATARLTADLRGAPTIEEAYADMKRRASRRDAIESADPGGSGRVDPSDPAATKAADRLRRALTEEH
jgi:hypothetical protein